MMYVNFFKQPGTEFQLDPTKDKDFLHRYDVTKVGDIYNGGLWENLSFFVGSN